MQPWAAPPDEVVHRAITEICETQDLEALMLRTRRSARALTGADGVSLVLRAGDSCYYVDEDAIAPLWKGQRFPLGSCISGWVMQRAEPVLITDIYDDPRIPHDVYRPTFVKSLVMVPVRRDKPVAAIGAYWKTEAVPTRMHVRLVELLADAVSVGLTHEQTWTRMQDWLNNSR